MTTLQSPGVLVREFDLSTNISAVSTSPGAFSGVFHWGPVNQPTLVDNEDILKDKFFKPTIFNRETWYTCKNFLDYTNNLTISRAADITGNTINKTFSGNSTVSAIEETSNILKLANTTNLKIGMKLLFSNNVLLPLNSKITSVNSTSVILDKSVSANVQSIEVVFREDVSYSAAALQSDLNYDASDIGDWDSLTVANEHEFENRTSSFDPAALYVARYPGDPGNSLRISQCDSVESFSSNTVLSPNAYFDADLSVFTSIAGSNVLSVTVSPTNVSNTTLVTAANAYISIVKQKLSTGDLVEIGNTKIGFQFLTVTEVSNVVNTGNSFSFQITCDDPVKLSSNVSNSYLKRYWEFYNTVDIAPIQSDYVLNFGNTAANDEMHVVVVDEDGAFSGSPGAVLEVYRNVSRASDSKTLDGSSNYYKSAINSKSKYVWCVNDRTTATSNTADFVTSSIATKPLNMKMVGGSSGMDENDVSLSTVALAWDLFRSSEDVDVSLLMQGKAKGELVSNKTQLANYIIDNVADQRDPKDCVVFISPDKDDVVNNKGEEVIDVKAFASNLRPTSYGFLDSGYKLQYDKYSDVNFWAPLNGDMAGLAARTDLTNDPWWSFAGLTRGQIKNSIRLAWNPRKAERDELYKANINPVISEQGKGTYLNGDKTLLGRPSAFDRINVRRLFIVLEKAIARASKFSLFEFNDDFTRAQFRNMVIPYLRDVKGRRGIYDFRVVCDATNNTPEVIDRKEFVGTIFIKPARSINYITLNFVAVRTGVSFETVAGFGG